MTVAVLEAEATRASVERRQAVRLEGTLFSPDLVEQLRRGEGDGQRPADFGLPPGRSLLDEVAAAYRDALGWWQVFRRRRDALPQGDRGTSLTREEWIRPLLHRLGYVLERNRTAYRLGDQTYFVSHRAGRDGQESVPEDAPPVHVAGARQELGRVDPSGVPRLSPHALVQEYLNRSGHLWGLVTNGLVLRVLRATPALRRQAYLEFDLEALFEGERFEDFVLLYRLLHRSRLPSGIADAADCWLERYHQRSVEEGARARDRLRDGVERCLLALGNGFLQHPKNAALRQALLDGECTPKDFYTQLLQLVYRLLFLLVVEERGLLGGDDLYRRHYSVSRLRALADRRVAATDDDDLWLGLLTLWQLLRDPQAPPQLDGRPPAALLGLHVLDGSLFAEAPFEQWRLANRDLLAAARELVTLETERGERYPVNYAALDVEELGSVYESLLDNQAEVTPDGGRLRFGFVPGTERKTTGSYYTPHELVHELVQSALVPVLAERLRAARTREEQERAILGLRVCDPAAGSGHFLLAAARVLAKRLAQVRTGEDEPSPERLREAMRDVVRHCLYAVDKNPLAVDLCKVALWIEGHAPGLPLTFLDHHVRCGDSLVGVFDLDVLAQGIPDDAYDRDDPEEKRQARALRQRNRTERRQRAIGLDDVDPAESLLELGVVFEELAQRPDRDALQVQAIASEYERLKGDPRYRRLRKACDLWTAAFFADLREPGLVPTTADVHRALAGRQPEDPRRVAVAEGLAAELRFFHWPLEFPDVFAGGGFDVVLGNPPWERVKLQEQEFFASRNPEVSQAPNAAERRRRIAALRQRNPALWHEYQRALRLAEAQSRFVRQSGRFPLGGRGDVNTYAVFAELAWRLLGPRGRAGVVVPTGIATDDTTKHLFGALVEARALVSLYDFENRQRLFPAVDSRTKFCLLTLAAGGHPEPAEFAFFLHRAEELRDPERVFALTAEDFARINPNTRTCPVFRSRRDAELTRAVYARVPVLWREGAEDGNPWSVSFMAMLHMANHSGLFRTRQQLEAAGYRLAGNVFVRGEASPGHPLLPAGEGSRGDEGPDLYLPLYEAKLAHQSDHRWASYGGPGRLGGAPEPGGPPWLARRPRKDDDAVELTAQAKADPALVVLPRYWVAASEVEARLAAKGWTRGWLLGWRDICRSTDERTVIAAVLPRAAVGDTFLLMFPGASSAHLGFCLLANLCSFALDYVARQKVGGTHLKYHVFKQLPVLPPQAHGQPCPWHPGLSLAGWFRPRALELLYTAWDLAPFARDLGYDGPPFRWDEERRLLLRCELDAAYFHLYGLAREEVDYVLGTFPIVAEHDRKRYGEFRTARLVLELYDALARAAESGLPYRTPLDPPPADPRAAHPARSAAEEAAGASD